MDTELLRVNQPTGAVCVDVVFVHGLGGHSDATWRSPDSADAFWPAWLGQDVPGGAVWTLGYDASPSNWLGEDAMGLVDRGINVLERLHASGLGVRPLVFVCHSLGGLVVKQLLRTAQASKHGEWHQFSKSTKGIAFIATPHTGSRIADYIDALGSISRPSKVLKDLKDNEQHLRDLSTWYSESHEQLNITTLAFFETQDTKGVRVVDETSANPGGRSRLVPVDADHVTISKPLDREKLVYASVLKLVRDLSAPVALASGPDGAIAPLPQPGLRYVSSFYVGRKWELKVSQALTTGSSVTVYGAERFGKTWFANRIRELLPQVCWLELNFIDCRNANFSEFLQCIAFQFCEQLERQRPDVFGPHARPSEQIDKIWARPGGPQAKFETALRGYDKEVLESVVVVCDDVDTILPSEGEFTALDQQGAQLLVKMLQAWVQKRDMPRFLFTVSTTADRMDRVLGHSSPFSRTKEFDLEDLGDDELEKLARTYGLNIARAEMETLMKWVGGHPFLSSIAFERVCAGEQSVGHVQPAWFVQHTDRLQKHLDAAPALKAAMARVCGGDKRVDQEEHANQLRRIGLVVGEQGTLAPRNALYQVLWSNR